MLETHTISTEAEALQIWKRPLDEQDDCQLIVDKMLPTAFVFEA